MLGACALLAAGESVQPSAAGPAQAVPAQAVPAQPARAQLEEDPALPGLDPSPALVSQLARVLEAKGPAFQPLSRHRDAGGRPLFVNRLIRESSPYLLQHANNPVSWYAWGDEPFERARRERKPVLLSIGYSTCHWCHVMERESFEDLEIARYLNEHFVAIKVDREERPDLDAVYMTAVQLLTGDGGWPMTLALTPDRQPFFGGTYFPARDGDRGARIGFFSLLRKVRGAYDEQPDAVLAAAGQLSRAVRDEAQPAPGSRLPGPEAIRAAVERLAGSFDPVNGGFGGAPRFPSAAELALLARYHRRTGDAQALRMVVRTLEAMARGGIHDQLGGGFHRYATDARWLKPHFEKMLYDQAQLARAYLDGFQLTGREDFAAVVRDTLDFVAREMTDSRGAFFSASDADSPAPGGEEVEGYFFTWTPAEVEKALGRSDAKLFDAAYGVTRAGDLEGRSILRVAHPVRDGRDRARLAHAREKLLAARGHRPPPAIDRKVLTSWNGLMIAAFARASFVLREPRYAAVAARAAEALLASARRGGEIRHTGTSDESFLDDAAALAEGLIALYESTGDARWLMEALALQRTLDTRFRDAGAGGYFLTPEGAKPSLAREKPGDDGAVPSGNSIAAMNLLRLGALTGDDALRKRALEVLSAFASVLPRMPAMLAALDSSLDDSLELVVVRPRADAGDALVEVARKVYLPAAVLAIATEGADLAAQAKVVPIVQDKRALRGLATAFVCSRGVCDLPTSDPAALERRLSRARPLFRGQEGPAPLPVR